MEYLTAEKIAAMSETKSDVNRLFLTQDDSDLWPISGKFNVTKRAINRIKRLQAQGLIFDSLLSYALAIEQITSEIVNDENNW
jgi:predicted transcriptional regulator